MELTISSENIIKIIEDKSTGLVSNINKLIVKDNIKSDLISQIMSKLSTELTHIIFSSKFVQPIDDIIWSDNILNIEFETNSRFNYQIDNLPINLIELKLGAGFNQPVTNLPNKLKKITFGLLFNQQIDNLPNSLTHLILDASFNQPIDNLPSNLTHLTIGNELDYTLNNLPSSLTNLVLKCKINYNFINIIFPRNLIELKIIDNIEIPISNINFPESLEILILPYSFNQSLTNVVWPVNLKILKFGEHFKMKLPESILSSNIQEITLFSDYPHNVDFLKGKIKVIKVKYEIYKDPNPLLLYMYNKRLIQVE